MLRSNSGNNLYNLINTSTTDNNQCQESPTTTIVSLTSRPLNIIRTLSTGAFSSVYEVSLASRPHSRFALKISNHNNTQTTSSSTAVAQHESHHNPFVEMTALQRIHHENVLPLLESDIVDCSDDDGVNSECDGR
eukprot:CAMPEP_0172516146 /NCGR_PEP_ID=MMETSP1066-20121228/273697_1 /TAXON_ID=671091 /ORGANISM="Coscinodiscus wailesii, Strain CCMP2513" /LENGTH=134 /DNA_ID=CAMNT_0013297501 /DNA_START=256 /DNA_END=657 /DNA_ORIENTATION=-